MRGAQRGRPREWDDLHKGGWPGQKGLGGRTVPPAHPFAQSGGRACDEGGAKGAAMQVGRLREGGCEHVGVPEMVGASSPLAPLVCVERMGSADEEGTRKRGANEGGSE